MKQNHVQLMRCQPRVKDARKKTAAVNVTLLAFAADRCAAVRRRPLQQSIDIACPQGAVQQTRRTLLQR